MKPIRILYTIFLLSTLSMLSRAPAFAQAPEATYRVRSSERVNLIDLHVDEASKDMFLLGEFENTISLSGWGNSEYTLASSAAPKNFFYAHCKADGVAKLWRISANPSSSQTAFVSQIAVATSYVYILGSFSGSLSVADDEGNTIGPINAVGVDIFLLKFSRADGSFVSLDRIGGLDNDYANRILVDQDDNVTFSGRFSGDVDFSLGSGADRVASIKTSQGNDVFVAKYNSGDDLLNITLIGGPENQDEIFGMIGDDDQNIYVVGKFNNSLIINSGSSRLSTTKQQQVFFTKLDANLNPQWLKLLEKSGDDTGGGVGQRLDVAYDKKNQQLLMVWETRWGPLVYDGQPLGAVPPQNNTYVLKMSATTGALSQQFSIGSDLYEDSKQITTDDHGNYLVSGTFQGKLEHTGGGLTKTVSKDGTNNTFLAAFGTHQDPATSDRLVYLNGFSNQGSVYASRRMFVFDQGSELQVYVPMVYEKGALRGLDDQPLSTDEPENLDILIAQYAFPSIPSVISASRGEATDPTTDPRYKYNVSGTNFFGLGDLSYRLMGDEGEITSGQVSEVSSSINSEGQEVNSLAVPLPADLVAGKSYHLELNKGIYENFYAFEPFSILPAVFDITDNEGTCEETLTVPGRYFGTVASDVQVLLYRGETEVGTATALVATGDELQIKLPPVYPDTYQLRVKVNGSEGKGGEVNVLPHITQITPASAPPGGTISVQGCAFIDATHGADLLTVTIQKEGGAVIAVTPIIAPTKPDEIKITLPESLDFGTYTLSVTVNGTLASGVNTFVVVDPGGTSPSIETLSPATTTPGEAITIEGKNLGADGEDIFVLIEGRPSIEATANEAGTLITFILPNDIPLGTYQVTVKIGNEAADGTLTLTVSGDEGTLETPAVTSGNVTDFSFMLSWEAIGGADSYRVEVNTDADFVAEAVVLDESITETSILIENLLAETTYHYRVRSQETAGKESGTNADQVTTLPPGGTEPAEVLPLPDNPTTYRPVPGDDSLSVTATGVQDTDSIQLTVEGLSSRAVATYETTSAANGRFGVPLSAISLDDPIGIAYHFVVKRISATITSTEVQYIYREYPLADMTLYKADKEQPQQADYQLVALPFQDQAVTTAWVGANSFDKDSIRLLRYDPANPSDEAIYQNYGPGGFSNFEPGRGYWLLKRKGIDLEVQGTAAEVDADRNFTIQLQEGWNLIGNPFPFAVGLSWLGDLDKRGYRNDRYEEVTDILGAYEGLFVESTDQTQVSISAVDDRSSRRASAEGMTSFRYHPLDSDNWFVGLGLSNGYATNELVGIGMHKRALDDYDTYDARPMPRFQRFVEAQFVNDLVEKPLERDIVFPAMQHTWKFNILADAASEEISIAWDNTSWGNNNRQLLLLDTETQRLINMREVTHYTFRPTQPERTFELYYGSEDELRERVMPHRVQVGAAFPNPATQQVSVSLSIPPSQPETDVRVHVTDIAGRTVQRLQQRVVPGFHTLSWGRQDERQQTLPSGLYFYRISVGKDQFIGKFIYQTE